MSMFTDLFKPLLSVYPINLISKSVVTERHIFYGVLIYMWLENAWITFLSLRQRTVMKTEKKVPAELEKTYSAEKFEKSRRYGLDLNSYGIIRGQYDTCVSTIMLWSMAHVYLWNFSAVLASWLSLPLDKYEITQTYFFLILNSCVDVAINLPFHVYKIFVIEENHGFNNQTMGFFVKDEIKKFIVNQILVFPLISGIVVIVKEGGDYFFLYCWLFVTVMIMFFMIIFPSFIAPLFDKFTSLPEGPLRERIEALATDLHFPLKKIFVVEGSKRSAHSNAYLYGMFSYKRIVLFDTLIKGYKPQDDSHKKDDGDERKKKEEEEEASLSPEEREKREMKKKEAEDRGCNDDEIVAVIAHELGHWYHSHFAKGLIFLLVNTLFAFIVFAQMFRYQTIYRAFGFHDSMPVIMGLTFVMGLILAPYKTVITFLMTMISRRREYEADHFGKSLGFGKDLGDALVKLLEDNLSFPVYDKLYSAWHHSHPTVIERVRALSKED